MVRAEAQKLCTYTQRHARVLGRKRGKENTNLNFKIYIEIIECLYSIECVVYTESGNVFVRNMNPQIHFRFSNTISNGTI